jgi:Zn-dependent peptidase ImmA (M78 family)
VLTTQKARSIIEKEKKKKGAPNLQNKTIRLVYLPFPESIRGKLQGIAEKNKEGFIIAIDSTRAPLIQRRTLGHELAHIFLNHYEQARPVALQEKEADFRAWEFYRAYKAGNLPEQFKIIAE